MRKAIARLPILGPAVIDLARSLRDPTNERVVQADLARTLREVAWLREAPSDSVAGAPRILILSLSDMVYQLKLEAMLGAALKLRGWRPIVLTNARTNTRALRYFRAFGITELIYLDDFPPDPTDHARCAEETAKLTSGPFSFQAVKAWTFAGSWIGPQILSTIHPIRQHTPKSQRCCPRSCCASFSPSAWSRRSTPISVSSSSRITR